jgi:hypothetical protein
VKALESIAKSPNQTIVMMPLEASAIIGSLAGLAEISKEAFGKGMGPSTGGSVPPSSRPANRTNPA